MRSALWVRFDGGEPRFETECDLDALIGAEAVVHSAAAATAMMRVFPYDLVIVVGAENADLHWNFVRGMRAANPRQRWIVLASNIDDGFERSARSLGALLVLERSISRSVLLTLLDELLDRSRNSDVVRESVW